MGKDDRHAMPQLDTLIDQAIFIIREAVAELSRPALLFSGGKDSAVLAHLTRLAFLPKPIPLPALHVDTGQNFPETLEFRDKFLAELGMNLIVVSMPEMIEDGRLAEAPGATSRNRLQGQALVDAVAEHGFDGLLGGARRDEEKARAKERVFSVRDEFGQWDPRNQRPELWELFNAKLANGQNLRIFPLSNWTEKDIWRYVENRDLRLPSLYYAHRRPVFERSGMLFAQGPFLPPAEHEQVRELQVRFRTIGDMTCTGAVESTAATPAEVIAELDASRWSERGASRADDKFADSAMEERKLEGYF
jgi:sulfate adenylyltransferase subunit 2